MQLDQLVEVYFYASRHLLDAAWDGAQRDLRSRHERARRERKKTLASIQKQFVKALAAQGITVIPETAVEATAAQALRVVSVQMDQADEDETGNDDT